MDGCGGNALLTLDDGLFWSRSGVSEGMQIACILSSDRVAPLSGFLSFSFGIGEFERERGKGTFSGRCFLPAALVDLDVLRAGGVKWTCFIGVVSFGDGERGKREPGITGGRE